MQRGFFDLLMKHGKKTYFYPSCGFDMHPYLFDLDYDLFVFSDYGDRRNYGYFCKLNQKKRAEYSFSALYDEYLEMQSIKESNKRDFRRINIDVRELELFWYKCHEKMISSCFEARPLRVHCVSTDFVLFEYNSKACILFFWDNNLTLAFLRDMGVQIACFIGNNDGCCEGGNYECVNTASWIKRVADISTPDGFLYITDHFNFYGTRGSESRKIPVIKGYSARNIDYDGWLQENRIKTDIFNLGKCIDKPYLYWINPYEEFEEKLNHGLSELEEEEEEWYED